MTVEIINPNHPDGDLQAAVFDFDGTLSLLRRNWQDVMIPMMVSVLAATGTTETSDQLYETVEDFVMRLNGRQTIYQMIRLSEEVKLRDGTPREPLEYKHQYHDLLWQQVGDRVQSVRDGRVSKAAMTVPGTHELLSALAKRGLDLYLASGTDLKYVSDEVDVLGLRPFFESHVYGALDDYKSFSKAMIIARIIRDTGLAGENVVGFGDGYVEIEEIKKVGGLAIGVASNEESRAGINDWKRDRLIQAGADVIIGDYHDLPGLFQILRI